MKGFLLELRRREVFRTAGLYVGICWILIEASSVLLPTFDAPEWILRWIIIAAVIGFPIMLVLAWVFDVTDEGIEVTWSDTWHTREPMVSIGEHVTDALIFQCSYGAGDGPDWVPQFDEGAEPTAEPAS